MPEPGNPPAPAWPSARPGNGRLDDDNQGGGADDAGGAEEVGDQPSDNRALAPGAAGRVGFEGEAEPPLARAQCGHIA